MHLEGKMKKALSIVCLATGLMFALSAGFVTAATHKPNIVVIWGDDVGQSNLSIYTRGMMGYQTPNIDRVSK